MMASVPVPTEPAGPDPGRDHVLTPPPVVDLEAAYREHYPSLVRLASLLVDDVGTCEEIVQEAFVRVWQRGGGAMRDPGKLPAYLRSAVLNGARSHMRKVVVRRRHLASVPPPGDGPEGSGGSLGRGGVGGPGGGRPGAPAGVSDPVDGPEAGALAADETRLVLAALRTLPERQREVLALRYYLDLSEAEIAATLGISAGSVKTHAHRGLAALTDRLEALR
jgi:RNA polymerase sigma factor (sigma-70 family)